jgi:hypothetical protein
MSVADSESVNKMLLADNQPRSKNSRPGKFKIEDIKLIEVE